MLYELHHYRYRYFRSHVRTLRIRRYATEQVKFDGLGHHYNWHAREKDREIVC